ncbi:hypothetical protein CERSUDRAFT_110928 [Gelatoporia subvermispora B]|uniref:Thioesterase domain-containing protein n=1 Tax=Ceriporiopsis subvermispora (strain B) TaxID=914234 RepID=M2R7C1_CERS8|nr:hypothetical protein CERSUDRAFT_110928 [Gelatoporia subvermispora B]
MSQPRYIRNYQVIGVNTQGNLADRFRQSIAPPYGHDETDFEACLWDGMVATEMNAYRRPEDGKQHARGIFELTVDINMQNRRKTLHGGCIATLIDVCTSLVLNAIHDEPSVTQVLDTVFHAPVPTGARVRIVCDTISIGKRAITLRCEVWDITNNRLAATGVHVKMSPSPAKL